MCGRYTLTTTKGLLEDLELAFGEPVEASEWWRPRFNIAPTQPSPVVLARDGERRLELLRWGLVPPWADSLASGAKMINARVEGLAARPAFRDALRHRRCLVVADGFLEWRPGAGKRDRVPIYLRPVPQRVVTFAGLWERWKGPDGIWVPSFTIITGPANALVAPFHDRMPVVLERAHHARWLAGEPLPDAVLGEVLAVPAVADWQAAAVSPRVNNVIHDDPACLEPVEDAAPPPPVQGRLFD